VHRGIGEMQKLASDVGSLSRVLNNVKTRGVLGEVQLAGLLEQVFTVDQYATNRETVPGSGARVEFAIKLPGRRDDGEPLWLPIDCKFPREDYERLLQAQEEADRPAAEAAGRRLDNRLLLEARTIREKYVSPPHTTDFGIMFLPTEGLYAEALRRPGLVELLQREHKVMLTGPTTLLATLTSLQMGFRTLALEKRSTEVWGHARRGEDRVRQVRPGARAHAPQAPGGEQDDRPGRGAHARRRAKPAQRRGTADPRAQGMLPGLLDDDKRGDG
jgi:DNA recombination protein RmuC